MSEKIICTEFDDTQTTKIILKDYIHKQLELSFEPFLSVISKYDESLVEKLLPKYQEKLNDLNISVQYQSIIQKLDIDISEFTWLRKYDSYQEIIENAMLHFLNFSKYETKYQPNEELEIVLTDKIRGSMYAIYYLVYTLYEFLPREKVLAIAREWTDQLYDILQEQIKKHETLEDMFQAMHGKDCWKTHNIIAQIIDDKYYLKVTRCIWAEVYAELPDLELASLMECYGDFSKMPYINPNLKLSRTKTLVEGHDCCDFVHYDKRIHKKIDHPEEKFWKEFK